MAEKMPSSCAWPVLWPRFLRTFEGVGDDNTGAQRSS
eukprot:CAMPEP_0180685266 /NCGR_PEP_ID=MMETSP1037_2-20121125/72245_1 /TAXON_ID=632150 /ORGANISM="Azadinium spinosum, Strain 3D9" /LENGTH=36 /DNA_ID= /DNA_START= /DNA_END= /DNA_ORIENTATION=